jgi:hypothetical protein
MYANLSYMYHLVENILKSMIYKDSIGLLLTNKKVLQLLLVQEWQDVLNQILECIKRLGEDIQFAKQWVVYRNLLPNPEID